MKRILILLTITLLTINGYSQQREIDKLKSELNGMHKDTAWILKTEKLFKLTLWNNLEDAKSINKEILQIANNLKYDKGIVLAYRNKGDIGWSELQFDTGKYYLDKALTICKKIKDTRLEASVITTQGITYLVNRQRTKAAELFYQSQKICENTHDTALIALNDMNLAIVYMYSEGMEKSEPLFLKSLE